MIQNRRHLISAAGSDFKGIKQSGFVSDHIGGIVGSGLGFTLGALPAITAAGLGRPVEEYWPTVFLPFMMSPFLGSVGSSLIDSPRMLEKVRGKTINHYRQSKEKLKEMGLSKEELNEILKYPVQAKEAALKQALDVQDKEFFAFRPVSATVGKLNDQFYEKALGIPTNTASTDNAEIQNYLESIKDHPALKNVSVHLGSSRPIDKLFKIWQNEDNEFVDKLYASATLPTAELGSAFFRSDHFDPNSNTVTVYHDSPAVLAHELGHALDYNTAQDKNLFRQIYSASNPVPQEYLASNLAVNKLTDTYFKDKANLKNKLALINLMQQAEQLERALGTYVANFGTHGVSKHIISKDKKAKTALEFFLSHPKYAKKIKSLIKKHKIKINK
jgi:hypothetical protein